MLEISREFDEMQQHQTHAFRMFWKPNIQTSAYIRTSMMKINSGQNTSMNQSCMHEHTNIQFMCMCANNLHIVV